MLNKPKRLIPRPLLISNSRKAPNGCLNQIIEADVRTGYIQLKTIIIKMTKTRVFETTLKLQFIRCRVMNLPDPQGCVCRRMLQVAALLFGSWKGVAVVTWYNTSLGLPGWLPQLHSSFQHPLSCSCHTQPLGAAFLTCFDEAGCTEAGAGADGAIGLAGMTWLASSPIFLWVSDSRKPPWPSQGCQS